MREQGNLWHCYTALRFVREQAPAWVREASKDR